MQYSVTQQSKHNNIDILPQGEYVFEVVRAEETTSKKNNNMIKLTLKIVHEKQTYWLADYLIDTSPNKIMYFMQSIGVGDNYTHGEITVEDCLGATGKLYVLQEHSDVYGIKNVVSKYINATEEENEENV